VARSDSSSSVTQSDACTHSPPSVMANSDFGASPSINGKEDQQQFLPLPLLPSFLPRQDQQQFLALPLLPTSLPTSLPSMQPVLQPMLPKLPALHPLPLQAQIQPQQWHTMPSPASVPPPTVSPSLLLPVVTPPSSQAFHMPLPQQPASQPLEQQPLNYQDQSSPQHPYCLYVSGFDESLQPEALLVYFSQFGQVLDVHIPKRPSTRHALPFGFVTFAADQSFSAALAIQHTFSGKPLFVAAAQPRHSGPGEMSHTRYVQQGPPQSGRLPNDRLFVGKLPDHFGEARLAAYFERFGPLCDVYVPKEHHSGRSQGFAFVTFATEVGLSAALAAAPHIVDGAVLKVTAAAPRELGPAAPLETTAPMQQFDRLFVGKLPEHVDEEMLGVHFARFGTLTDVYLPREYKSDRTRGFGFVKFAAEAAASAALAASPHNLDGAVLELKRAQPKWSGNSSGREHSARPPRAGGEGRGRRRYGGGEPRSHYQAAELDVFGRPHQPPHASHVQPPMVAPHAHPSSYGIHACAGTNRANNHSHGSSGHSGCSNALSKGLSTEGGDTYTQPASHPTGDGSAGAGAFDLTSLEPTFIQQMQQMQQMRQMQQMQQLLKGIDVAGNAATPPVQHPSSTLHTQAAYGTSLRGLGNLNLSGRHEAQQ